MNKTASSIQGENVSDEQPPAKPLDLAQIYDQYAATLLGVLTQIVADKVQATALLELVFRKLIEQTDQLQKTNQPLFVSLLQLARRTAMDALKERQQSKIGSLQLANDGKVRQMDGLATPAYSQTQLTEVQRQELLNYVLFKNCTPEEAASLMGLPVERARQHLRLAFQQVRMPKA